MMTKALTISVPTSAPEVARLQVAAEADLEALGEVVIDTPDEYEIVDAFLSDVVRRKDAAVAMRRTATGPMKEAIATVEGWFRPLVVALEGAEKRCKGAIGAYRLAQANAEREARELAATAAEKNDDGALLEALEKATEAAAPAPGRATVGFSWNVGAVDRDKLPAEYLAVDWAKLAAVAKAHKGDDPPAVPGVAFERVANVGARR